MKNIDLNCDMGEAYGQYSMPNDELLMDYISSANIACGFHAGDPTIMYKTVQMAIKKGVAIGAHPGLPDLQGFGRRNMQISPNEAYHITLYQIGALNAFTKASNTKLHHVKPHGALYNMAATDVKLAEALAQAVWDFDPNLIFYGLAGSEMITAAKNIGLKTTSEVFADRSYQDNGTLTPRNMPNALLNSTKESINQVWLMVNEQKVISTSGKAINIQAETICLHGDGTHALDFAKNIHQTLINKGINIKAC